MKIWLASKSPRRRDLLTQIGVSFEVLMVDTPEIRAPGETPEQYSLRVTAEKMAAAWQKIMTDHLAVMPVLSADTEVVLDDQILGKPGNYQDAFAMLRSCSGRSHEVITSVGVQFQDYHHIKTNKTRVRFATMTDDNIHQYLSAGDYLDKAGGYGIQSGIGQYIEGIDGCFYSVMGLPLHTVRLLLDDLNNHFLF